MNRATGCSNFSIVDSDIPFSNFNHTCTIPSANISITVHATWLCSIVLYKPVVLIIITASPTKCCNPTTARILELIYIQGYLLHWSIVHTQPLHKEGVANTLILFLTLDSIHLNKIGWRIIKNTLIPNL